MSASFTLSPPYTWYIHNLLQPHTGPARFIHILSTYTNSPISIHNKYISHNDTHTPHTQPHPLHPQITTHNPTHTPQHIPLSPPTHTPTYIHYPKHPNLHPIPPQTLHYNIFKVSNLLQYTYGIAVPLQLLSTNTWTLS